MIERGNARSWRFLETSGVLDAALPELAEALRRRAGEGFWLDRSRPYGLQATERLRRLDADDPLALEIRALEHIDRLLLAAFLIEALEDEPDPERARTRCRSTASASSRRIASGRSSTSATATCCGRPPTSPAR